jgi:hypothetical protein
MRKGAGHALAPCRFHSMLPLKEVEEMMRGPGKGFEMVDSIHECTYKESSTVIICPTRGKIDYRVVESWNDLIRIPNQRRSFLFCEGAEVGDAYNKMIRKVLGDHNLSRYKYLMTVEDDNILPADAHVRLLDTIQKGGWDAVSGLYFTRRPPHFALALGTPGEPTPFAPIDLKPRDVREAMDKEEVIEVNGIPMGCAIFRLDLFREIPDPWFTTVNQYIMIDGKPFGRRYTSHDLGFCENARILGKRIALDCGVKVGHLDAETGVIF